MFDPLECYAAGMGYPSMGYPRQTKSKEVGTVDFAEVMRESMREVDNEMPGGEKPYGDEHDESVERSLYPAGAMHIGVPKKLVEGTKFDLGKLRYDLLAPDAIQALVGVLTYGANKYADRNWEKGIKYGRVLAALRRHIASWEMGESYDPETGYHHLAHAMCCLMFLLTYELRGMEEWNDLPILRTGTLVIHSGGVSTDFRGTVPGESSESPAEGFFGFPLERE